MNIIEITRIKKGVTVEEMAMYLNISVLAYEKLERNYNSIKLGLMLKITGYLGIEIR